MQLIGKVAMIPDKLASSDDGRSPLDDQPELLLDEHIPLLKSAIWVILVGAIIYSALLLAPPQEHLRRLYVTSALVMLAASALLVLSQAGAAAALRLFAIGGWILVTVASFVGEGVRTPMLLSYPVVLMFSGWLLGVRYCLVFFAMSCVAVVAMALGEHSGALTAATPVPPYVVAAAHLIVLSVSAVTTLYLLQAFRKRYAAELRLNEILQSSETRFRNLLQSVPTVAVQGYAEDGTTRYWNQASERLYGYSAEEAIGRNLLELIIPAEMRDGVRAAMRQMFESGQPIPAGELSLMRKDGSRAEVFSCHAYVQVPGQAPEMFCLDVDLSERKRMEDALLIKDAIVEASLNGIALSDLQGRLTYVNAAFCKMWGIPSSAAIGRPAIEFWRSREDPEKVMDAVRQQGLWTGEMEATRPDGQVFSAMVSASLVRDRAGDPIGMMGAFTDITERRQAEKERSASEEKYRNLYRDAALGIFHSTFDGKFIDLNPALARMLGYDSPEDVLGSITEISKQVYAEQQKYDLVAAEVLEAGGLVRSENRYRRKDGTLWDGVLNLRIVRDHHGQRSHYEGFIEDVTQRKHAETERARLEAQLRESQKMEALGTMAGGVAHDFNNALAAILGNVELAREDVGPAHPALVSLEEIGKASRRAKALVQQILAFGRRQKMERKPMSLALVVVETARLIRASIPAMLTLNVNCEADTPAVLADATQIEQILLNLCSNAAHAVEDIGRPGVIEINLSACERADANAFGDLGPRRYACLTVRDNGRGMDEATRSRIFEPFFTTKQAGKGTGLGLSVVHGIVQAHEASIEVESASGQGSTFRIYFPAIEAPAETVLAPTPEATPAMGMGKHVLYLDDEEAIIFLMKRLLGRKGYRVSGYTDPGKALAAVRADPGQFDLAVTDYYMPGMSGLEVAQALKEIRPDLPIVMASGYVSEELRAKAPAAGVSKLIYKPNTVEDLCEAVARFANGQSGSNS